MILNSVEKNYQNVTAQWFSKQSTQDYSWSTIEQQGEQIKSRGTNEWTLTGKGEHFSPNNR